MASHPQMVRYKTGKHHFEVLCNPGMVLKWRKQEADWNSVLFTDTIFKNYHKVEKANNEELKGAFGTEDIVTCLQQICSKGIVQETANERKEKVDKKRKEIVNYLHKYFINPKTNTPHPVTRLELALDEMKAKIDPEIAVDRQIQDILKKLTEIIPMKKSEMDATLTVPTKVAGSVQGIIHKYSKMKSENWSSTGCTWEISLVPGDYDHFISDLTKATKGEFQFEVAGGGALSAGTEEETPSKKGKGKKGNKK